jgi:hypothetical protein
VAAANVDPAASFFAYSAIFRVDTGDPTVVPAGTPGNIVTSIFGQGFAGISGSPIPEPTTAAWFGLGAFVVLQRRRWKG